MCKVVFTHWIIPLLITALMKKKSSRPIARTGTCFPVVPPRFSPKGPLVPLTLGMRWIFQCERTVRPRLQDGYACDFSAGFQLLRLSVGNATTLSFHCLNQYVISFFLIIKGIVPRRKRLMGKMRSVDKPNIFLIYS